MGAVELHTARMAVASIPVARIPTVGREAGSRPPLPGEGVDNLLLESGGNMLLEDGGVVLLEKEVVKQLNRY